MRFRTVLAAFALATTAAAQSSGCDLGSTIYVSVPGPTVTVTVDSVAAAPTTTYTSILTYTNVVSAIPTSSDSLSASQSHSGTYYYSVFDGTTSWLNNNAPTGTGPFATGPSTMLVYPMPVSSASSVATVTVTETSEVVVVPTTASSSSISQDVITTVQITSFVTLTNTVTNYYSSSSGYGSVFTGIGTSGWNTSSTAAGAVPATSAADSSSVGTAVPNSGIYGSGVYGSGSETGSPKLSTASSLVSGSATTTQGAESVFSFQFPNTAITSYIVVTVSQGVEGGPTSSSAANSTEGSPVHPTSSASLPTGVFPSPPLGPGPVNNTQGSPGFSTEPTSIATSAYSSSLESSALSATVGISLPLSDLLSTSTVVGSLPVTSAAVNATSRVSTSYVNTDLAPTVTLSPPGLPFPSGIPNPHGTSLAPNATQASTQTQTSSTEGAAVNTTSTKTIADNVTMTIASPSVSSDTISTTLQTSSRSALTTAPPSYVNVTVTQSVTTLVVVTVPAANATSSSAPTPTACGVYGNFTLTWDDEPVFTPTNATDVSQYPPVFNPYHHLFFSNGYAYVPPTVEPFEAESLPHLAIFLPNLTDTDVGSPYAAGVPPGEIGAGPRGSIDAYWINAYGAFVGCDNAGPEDCTMTISGYTWNATSGQEELAVQQNATLPPCASLTSGDCELTEVTFSSEFHGLSGIQFEAFVEDSERRIFLLDNLSVGWYNNTCAAGLLRFRSRK